MVKLIEIHLKIVYKKRMNMINWKKKGLLFKPDSNKSWMRTHTMTPRALHLNDNLFRVFFSGRNDLNQSNIGYVDIEVDSKNKEIKVLSFPENSALGPGELGCFDDSGVTPSCLVNVGEKTFLYYIGWRARSTVRMELVGGLAISDNKTDFKRYSKAPILNKTDKEPINILTAPFVMKDDNLFKMWYVSGIRWVNPDLPQYDIKYAESKDGIQWNQTGKVAIPLIGDENALATPFVIKEDNIYKMWYSYKKDYYRIGYAESSDGINWERKDSESGISVSEKGWDSEMIGFASIFEFEGIKYMLYNGNEYGKNGVGYAVEEK